MRKYLKKKLLNMVDTLKRAEDSLKSIGQIREGQEQCALLLEEMQSCAIEIGEAIEDSEGEGTQSVALLEQYCELLWECLNEGCGPVRQRLLKEIQCTRGAIGNQIQGEFSEECEVLFLPYKASMWDSMESIYKAFCRRGDCRCTVMPIPYYSKNPDGTPGQEYYEGALYPEDVPVTHYEDYDLGEQYPDVIIIHNPYDDMNYVTSVDPRFYARNLRQYTDCLVYVPYYIINGGITAQFCQTPAALLADLVIVQSESIRETHIQAIEAWMEQLGKKGVFSRSSLEKKFLALGSPKADKVIRSKREDFFLPEEWRERLEGKRAVLYNTGVTGILQGNEQELAKIEDVIETFRGKEDAVLWWRPHPLSESTCASMRPELLERYQELVRRYKEEGDGIYDDTPDLNRGMAWTDFYYGDSSSLTALYGLTGKPVVMQNKAVLSHKGGMDRTLIFTAYVEEEGETWLFARNFNGFFYMNGDSPMAEYLGGVPGEKGQVLYLFTCMLKEGDTIWLIPGRGSALVKYDIKEKKFVRYELPEEEELQAGDIKFRSAYLEGDKLYLVPSEQPYFVVFDKRTGTWQTDDFWKRRLEKKDKVRLKAPYFYDSCLVEREKALFLPVHGTNLVIEYSLQTGRTNIHRVGEGDHHFSFISSDGKDLYLASRDWSGRLYRWNRGREGLEVLGEYPEYFREGACVGLLTMGGEAYLMPSVGRGLLKVNLMTGESRLIAAEGRDRIQFYSMESSSCGHLRLMVSEYGGNKGEFVTVSGDGEIQNRLAPTMEKDMDWVNCNPFEQLMGSHTPLQLSGCMLWEVKENHLAQQLAWSDSIVSAPMGEIYKGLFANADGSCGEKTVDQIWSYLESV